MGQLDRDIGAMYPIWDEVARSRELLTKVLSEAKEQAKCRRRTFLSRIQNLIGSYYDCL
jgi:hypothetical protein